MNVRAPEDRCRRPPGRISAGADGAVPTAARAVLALQAAAGNRAVARMVSRERALARCAGGCTCGGKCRGTSDAELERSEALRRARAAVVSRRVLARDVFDSGQQVLTDLCAELNTSTNAPVACAANAHCPSGFCAPLDSQAEAIGIRNLVKTPLLAGIRVKVNPRVVPFWDDYLGSGFGVGGDPAVRDLSSGFGADFTNSPTTDNTTRFLTQALVADLEARRPSVAPGDTTTVDIPTRIPSAVAAITTPGGPNEMNFNIPADIAGNVAGGIGADEAACRVGAHPSPQNDDRIATGTAKVTGNADGSLTVEPDITFVVHDTIDLCPGDCGTHLEQCATGILSRLEATGVSGDIPFKVTFAAPAQAAIRIAPAPPTPPVPPPPGPSTQLRCPRFLRSDGTPEPKLEACFEDRDRLRPGDRGQPVRMLQSALAALGYDLGPFGVDGRFGGDTASAVRAFKHKEHLGFEAVGDVGPGTMARLDALCPS
jgi:hypothetical protein